MFILYKYCNLYIKFNQARLFAGTSNVGLRDDMFCLGPKESCTLKWAVYPVAGPDYFDFINLVRKDWNSNFTVDGPYTLINPEWVLAQPVDKLRKQFARHGIKYVISNGSWRQGRGKNQRNAFGLSVFEDRWADHRSKLREAGARIREAAPGVKMWVYYDPMRDSSQGSNEKFKDSHWVDAKGQPLFTTWGGGMDNICYTYIPMLDNSFGKAMLAAVDRYIDETGSDGIYCDEMSISGSFNSPGITYKPLDGHSCLLDPKNYTIKREIGLSALLSDSWQRALVESARKRQGMVMLGNGAAKTHTMLATKVFRMLECQHNDFWCYESNLGSPLGWTYPAGTSFAATVRTLRQGCLPVGVPLSSTHEISRYLYPFTPVELHHGYLLGEERIITIHDGNYGWVGKRCLVQPHHFDKNGMLVKDEAVTHIGKEARTAVNLAEGEAMVLERLPINFAPSGKAPASWNAQIKNAVYDKNFIAFDLDAPQGGILQIDSGKFSLQNGKEVKVLLDNKPQSFKVIDNTLNIPVPENFSGQVNIK